MKRRWIVRAFVRQKTIYCGDKYREVDIFPYTQKQGEVSKRGKRSKKKNESPPKQKNLNDKNARRYLVQLGNLNFNENDLSVTATYSNKYLPETIEQAEKEITNYLRRIQYQRKKRGLPALRYILVTACSTKKNRDKPVRIHHHILMDGALDRNIVEDLWRKRIPKGKIKHERIGYINADRIQPDENGISALCVYLVKQPGGKKRWSSSQNLKKPQSRNNDSRYSRRKIENIINSKPDRSFWEKKYPGWTLTDDDYGAEYVYNELTGWAIYLKLRKIE